MKKKFIAVAGLILALSISACGNNAATSTATSTETSTSATSIVIKEDPVVVSVSEEKVEEEAEVIPENSYRSELTNEWISNDLKDQRPIAVMIDNESIPLPHYGTSDADIVYELMNSTANGRITRLMAIIKDYNGHDMIGSIRSVRPTNIILAPEYNAILVHDGGPFYINEWFAYDNAGDHLSGGFARIDRGNASFYEEYATTEHYTGVGEYAGNSYKSINERLEASNIDTEYNQYYMGQHFKFSDKTFKLSDDSKNTTIVKAEKFDFPYPHNESELQYNKETGLYDYYEYGDKYIDALYDDGRGLSFENVIVYRADFVEYDEHGYMCYYAIGSGVGYYATEGELIPITWEKKDMYSLTSFKNGATGEDIVLNTGKTYITIVPMDVWDSLVVE